MKLPSPVTGKRLKKLLDDKRLIVAGSTSRPTGTPRVVILDEVDSYPPPEHQRPTITTRADAGRSGAHQGLGRAATVPTPTGAPVARARRRGRAGGTPPPVWVLPPVAGHRG